MFWSFSRAYWRHSASRPTRMTVLKGVSSLYTRLTGFANSYKLRWMQGDCQGRSQKGATGRPPSPWGPKIKKGCMGNRGLSHVRGVMGKWENSGYAPGDWMVEAGSQANIDSPVKIPLLLLLLIKYLFASSCSGNSILKPNTWHSSLRHHTLV